MKTEVLLVTPFLADADEKLLSRMIYRAEDPDTRLPLKESDFPILRMKEGDAPTAAILTYKPKSILALGDLPFETLTGSHGVTSLRGYVFPTRFGPVVGSYAPEYIRMGKLPLADVFRMDLRRAISTARHGIPTFAKAYTLNPTYKEVFSYLENYRAAGRPPLAFDIETPWSKIDKDSILGDPSIEDDASYTILRISFSFAPGKAITFPWSHPYIGVAKLLLSDPGDKLVWNQHFDVPRLSAAGCTFGGPIYDGMDAWHFLEPSLPMGLKYCATFFCPDMHAWKLESREQPEWYSCADSDVLLRCFSAIRGELEKQGRWGIFKRHFVDLTQVLRKMSSRGVLVDPVMRAKKFEEFEEKFERLKGEMQPLVPLDIKKKKIYKKPLEWLQKKGVWTPETSTNFIELTSLVWTRKEKPPKEKKERKRRECKEKSPLDTPSSKRGRRKKTPPVETAVETPAQSISSVPSPDPST